MENFVFCALQYLDSSTLHVMANSTIEVVENLTNITQKLFICFANSEMKANPDKYHLRWNLLLVTRYFLLFTCYSLLFTFHLLLVTFYLLLVIFYSLLVTFYSLLITTYLSLCATYLVLIRFYWHSSALYSQCSHQIIRQFLKKKITLMDVFLLPVDIICYDVDLIVFRLNFQEMTNE